ncbi:unnamed protein product [Cochlearia groenlandica]
MAGLEETKAFTQDEILRIEIESRRFQVDSLESEILNVKSCLDDEFSSHEDARKELATKVTSALTTLQYLRSKARNNDHSEEEDTMVRSIEMVSDVFESLVMRVTEAESETDVHKEMLSLGEEVISKKTVHIENLSSRLKDMDEFARKTGSVLTEMKERIGELVEETMRQKEKAVENEEELCRVKTEFESLKSYVSNFTNVRETLVSSERQFKIIEELFERLVTKTTQLEGEKAQKEVEVQKLMEENVKLTARLDKKEAQLLALNEQCKVMALSASNM